MPAANLRGGGLRTQRGRRRWTRRGAGSSRRYDLLGWRDAVAGGRRATEADLGGAHSAVPIARLARIYRGAYARLGGRRVPYPGALFGRQSPEPRRPILRRT